MLSHQGMTLWGQILRSFSSSIIILGLPHTHAIFDVVIDFLLYDCIFRITYLLWSSAICFTLLP
jgi:hypothetical protein